MNFYKIFKTFLRWCNSQRFFIRFDQTKSLKFACFNFTRENSLDQMVLTDITRQRGCETGVKNSKKKSKILI